ncbi:phosphatidylserine decarboxylase, partial [Campylobacter coli]|nr:phosphatidylserine decarboxylase [Campylobacter coli]
YTSGALYSVNEKHLERISNLYVKNERVSLKCQNEKGIFWLVFVGAQNVGKMRFKFDTSIQTNAKFSHNFTRKYENLELKKGEELGNFELGSTIVLIAQKGLLDIKLKAGQNVKFGEKIAD